MVAMVGYTFTMLIYRVVSHQGQKSPTSSLYDVLAMIWLIYVIVWLLGYCKWLLGVAIEFIGDI